MLQAFRLHEQPPPGNLIEEGRREKGRAPGAAVEASASGFNHCNVDHGGNTPLLRKGYPSIKRCSPL